MAKSSTKKVFEFSDDVKSLSVKYLPVVDWFEIMCRGWTCNAFKSEYKCGMRVKMVKDDYLKTRSFRFAYKIYLDGREFARLFCGANEGSIIDPTYCQLKVLNHILYEREWIERLDFVLAACKFKYKNTTKLDLALDGYGFIKPIADYFTRMNEWQKVGRAHMKTHGRDRDNLEGFDFGGGKQGGEKQKKAAKKRFTIYNKTNELKGNNKHYIRERWLEHGLTKPGYEEAGNDVERLELKLTNDGIKAIADYDYHLLDDAQFIASIIRTSMQRFVHFVIPDNPNISRCTQIEFVDWESVGAGLLPKWSAEPTSEIFSTKIACKKMTYGYFSTGHRFYLQAAYDLAENINCLGWFHDKIPLWQKDYRFKRKNGNLGMWSSFKSYRPNDQTSISYYNGITAKNEEAHNTIAAIIDA